MFPTIQYYKNQVVGYCSCYPEEIQGDNPEMRQMVLWENRQNRPSDILKNFMNPVSYVFPYLEKQ